MCKVYMSVIIPAYNAEKTIKETIESVVLYKGKDLEVIIVDDGSTDMTIERCKDIGDSRIKIISIKNSGVSAARNIGIKNASGGYCMFLDADDVLVENTWLEIMSAKEKIKQDFLIFGYEIGDEKLQLLRDVFPLKLDCVTTEDIYRVFATSTYMNFCWGKIYRTSFLLENNISFPVGIRIGEDIQFQMMLLQYNPVIKYINKGLVIYRQSEASVMHGFSIERFEDLAKDLIFRKKCLRLFNSTEVDSDLMYYDECRNLLSYVKRASKFISKAELRSILADEELNEILTNVKTNSLDFSMMITVVLLRLKMYYTVLTVLRRI